MAVLIILILCLVNVQFLLAEFKKQNYRLCILHAIAAVACVISLFESTLK